MKKLTCQVKTVAGELYEVAWNHHVNYEVHFTDSYNIMGYQGK